MTINNDVYINQLKPTAKAAMLIRKPIDQVFEAFINPNITSKFWFTKSSGKLEVKKQITWTWEMYNFSAQVNVREIEKNKKILIEWDAYKIPTLVEWQFTSISPEETFVTITNTGFIGNSDEVVEQAISSTEGFTLVLVGAKAFLEHNIILNLVIDRFPKEID